MTDSPLTPARVSSWLPGYVLLAVIWGSSFLFIKVGIRELHPIYVAFGRAAVGAVTALLIVAVMRHHLPRSLKVWGHLFVVGALGVSIPMTLFAYGEQRVSSILAGIWNATTPLFVLPVAVLVLGIERMTARKALGLGIGFVGVLIILGVWHGTGGAGLVGQLMCAGAALCYGFGIPYQRRYLSQRPEPGVSIVAGQLIMASLQLGVVGALFAGPVPAPATLSLDVVLSIVALGALGTAIAFAINFRIIRIAGASTSASVTYVIPIVSTLIGVVVLAEGIAWYQPVGAAVALLGVAISQGAGARRRVRAKRFEPRPAGLVAASPVE